MSSQAGRTGEPGSPGPGPRVRTRWTTAAARSARDRGGRMSVQTLEPEARGIRERIPAQVSEEPVSVGALADGDLDAPSPAADLVRVYLNGIGKTALLSAADEVELAKRIEAGVFAQHMLETSPKLSPQRRTELKALVRDGHQAKNHLL